MVATQLGLLWVSMATVVGFQGTLPHDGHGRIQMGVRIASCDDGVNGIEVDWDPDSDAEYTCEIGDALPIRHHAPYEECLTKQQLEQPEFKLFHRCLSTPLNYTDQPPRSGNHRPLWPKYGEYTYVPPQRWIHSLEHGAAVFLYHPCTPPEEVMQFRQIALGCLYRHIITPYKNLTTPFAIVTYGCRLMMSSAHDTEAAVDYLQRHAITDGPEKVSRNGQYDAALLHPADIVSDEGDSHVCPHRNQGESLFSDMASMELRELATSGRRILEERMKEIEGR